MLVRIEAATTAPASSATSPSTSRRSRPAASSPSAWSRRCAAATSRGRERSVLTAPSTSAHASRMLFAISAWP